MRSFVRVALALALAGLSAGALAAATVHEVTQEGRRFSRAELTVRAGDQVRVSNADPVTHSLFARGGGYDIRETQAPGARSTLTFDHPGTVEVRCAIHPQMVLTVTVTP